jgi:hypothetical protein
VVSGGRRLPKAEGVNEGKSQGTSEGEK